MSWIADNIDKEVADYLFTIKVKLPNRVGLFQRDIRADFDIDFDNLEEQLQETPSMIAFFSQLLAEQTAKVSLCERNVKTLRGQCAKGAGGPSSGLDIRRSDINDIVDSDASVIHKEDSMIIEVMILDKIKATVNALNKKFDALRSLAGFKKDEKRNT